MVVAIIVIAILLLTSKYHCNDFQGECLCSVSFQQRFGITAVTHFPSGDWFQAWHVLATRRSSQLQSLTELSRFRWQIGSDPERLTRCMTRGGPCALRS